VSEKAAVVATQTAREQAKLRYHGGVATYLEVVLTQSAALQAQLSAHGIQATRFATTALLIKALGGSWHEQRMAEAEKNTPGAGKEKGP
jgi:outer membrane protein TolC